MCMYVCICVPCMCMCHCKSHGLVVLGFIMTFPSLLQKAKQKVWFMNDAYVHVACKTSPQCLFVIQSARLLTNTHTRTTECWCCHKKSCSPPQSTVGCTFAPEAVRLVGASEHVRVRGCNQDVTVGSRGT